MDEDGQLLRRYTTNHSQAAFAELVRRHFNLVYFTAYRTLNGDAHRAQDVSQIVFIKLARRAAELIEHPALVGWLHTTSHNAAVEIVRSENRRQKREQEAQAMEKTPLVPIDPRPLALAVDQSLSKLSDGDRQVLLLRFFQAVPYAELGRRIGVGENAARMRVDRALERLRRLLAKAGLTSSALALSAVLTSEGSMIAPPGAVTSTTEAALAASAAQGSLTGSAFYFMSTTKTAVSVAAALILVGLSSVVAVREFRNAHRSAATSAAIAREITLKVAELQQLQKQEPLAAKRPNGPQPSARSDPTAEARHFFEAFPEARNEIRAYVNNLTGLMYAPFFRETSLTADQVVQFQRIWSDYMLNGMTLGPDGITNAPGPPPEEAFHQALGNKAYESYLDYTRGLSAYAVASQVAAAVSDSGGQLTPDQVSQLAGVVKQNSPEFVGGKRLNLNSVTWDAVLVASRGLLSPAQLAAANGVFLNCQLASAMAAVSQR